jgi:glycosyltransferase involved in cell wall biosynthesis
LISVLNPTSETSMPEGTNNTSHSVALVHDYLLVMRGAERSFAAIADCYADAPIFTLLYDPDQTAPYFSRRDVTTSYLQRLRVSQKGFRRLLPFFPRAVERLPLHDYDVVVSSSSAFAHGVRPKPGATHICYCHSPFRYAYFEREQTVAQLPVLARPVMNRVLNQIGAWDLGAARRVDHYIANSQVTRRRIADYYGRESTVIHPPVDVDRFEVAEPEDYFLIVCELVPHKRIGLALEAARRAGKKVRVVGSGPEREKLEVTYDGTAEFLGRVSDHELNALYSRAQALVVPNIEEFGIGMVEAQAAGRPVLAADAGGAQEIVSRGETGELVPVGDVNALAEAMRATDWQGFDSRVLVERAQRFSVAAFREKLTAEVNRRVAV